MHVCYACDLNYSFGEFWYLNRGTELALCFRCYTDILRRPKRFRTQQERNEWQSQQKKGKAPPNKGIKTIPIDRECYICGSKSSYFHKKTGKTHWATNVDILGNVLHVLCTRCNSRYFRNPISNARYSHNRMHFNKKDLHLQFNPRTGFCSNCGRVGKTHLHHDQYDEANPLAHTVELCMSCHMKETWRAKQLTTTIRDRNRPPKKPKTVYSAERYSAHHFAKKLCERKQCHINNQDCNGSLQVAHIDRNPLNNNLDNLVSLCRTHHAIMDNRQLTLEELKDLKLNYYYIKTKRRYLT